MNRLQATCTPLSARALTIVVVFALGDACAGIELVITPSQQQGNNTCWAACCEMILGAYGSTTAQSTIVNWAVGGQDVGNYLVGGATTVDRVLDHFAANVFCVS